MNKKTSVVWLAAGIVSVLALATPNLAQANHYLSHQRHEKARRQAALSGNWGELHRDRTELRKDLGELYRDRTDLRRDIRRGASADEIARKRAEIRQDLTEIAQDRREIRDDYGTLRRDSDWYGRNNGYPYRNNSNSRYDRYQGNRSGWWNSWFGR